MRELAATDLITLYTLSEVNTTKVAEDPLQLSLEPETEFELLALKDANKFLAKSLDPYNEFKICAVQYQGKRYYYMYCDDPAVKNFIGNSAAYHIEVFDSEQSLIAALFTLLNSTGMVVKYDASNISIFPSMLIGWKLQSEIWPQLLNKALHFNLFIPSQLKTDPIKKFSSVTQLYDIANIYLQGAYAGTRRLPPLATALTYWGYPANYGLAPEILQTVCTDPVAAVKMIEPYLINMEQVAIKYNTP